MISPPDDTPEFMHVAWRDCLLWAASEPSIVAAFQKDTGCVIPSRKGGIVGALERMIDRATGVNDEFVAQFAKWFNKNVWGDMGGAK